MRRGFVVNRAEKRGFLADAGALREMKDVRNMIAHDYAGAKAAEIFAYCRAKKPAFDEICTRVEAYPSFVGVNGWRLEILKPE